MNLLDLFESQQQCPECGGISFSDLILAEKKDACYYKVKASAKVWPSAYASGRLVQCRKKGADNYGNSKNEGVAEGLNEMDKTQTSPGRDGDIDWTKKQIHLGPEHIIKAKDVAQHALKALDKSMKKSHPHTPKKKGVAEAINPDITNPAFSHQQQIGDYLYVARYWSKGLKITAYHGAKQIGYAELMYQTAPFDDFADPKTTPKRVWLESEWTRVDPKYQRQGIMSTMYAYAKMLGNSVKPSELRSPDAKAAWASWRQSGDAKHLTSNEGVAEGKMAELEMDLEDPEITDRQFEKMYGMTRKEAREQFSQTDMWAFPEIRDPNRPLHERGVAEGPEELYGLRVGDTVKTEINGQLVQGDIIDIFPETMQVELLLRGANAGQTVTVDVQDTESLNEESLAEGYYDRGDYYSAKLGGEYGRDLSQTDDRRSSGFGNRHERDGRDDVFKGQSKNLPADPFARTTGAVPKSGSGKIYTTALPDEVDESNPREKEADYGLDYQDMVQRVKKLAGLGPLKTVWDPQKRVYKNVPTAVQPPKK